MELNERTDEQLLHLQTLVQVREDNIARMATMLAEISDELSKLEVSNEALIKQNVELRDRLEEKESQAAQEDKDVEFMKERISSLEKLTEELQKKEKVKEEQEMNLANPDDVMLPEDKENEGRTYKTEAQLEKPKAEKKSWAFWRNSSNEIKEKDSVLHVKEHVENKA